MATLHLRNSRPCWRQKAPITAKSAPGDAQSPVTLTEEEACITLEPSEGPPQEGQQQKLSSKWLKGGYKGNSSSRH